MQSVKIGDFKDKKQVKVWWVEQNVVILQQKTNKGKAKVRIIWQNVNFKRYKAHRVNKEHRVRSKGFTRVSTSMMLAAWGWL